MSDGRGSRDADSDCDGRWRSRSRAADGSCTWAVVASSKWRGNAGASHSKDGREDGGGVLHLELLEVVIVDGRVVAKDRVTDSEKDDSIGVKEKDEMAD